MNKDLFRNEEDMLAEVAKLVEEDYDDACDRAAITAFYNGRETMTQQEAMREGKTEIKNHLMGYDSIVASKEQIASVTTKSPTVWVTEVQNAPASVKDKWSFLITKHWNDTIRQSRRLKPVQESIAGNATLVGSGFYVFADPFDWCPMSRRPLVPRGTGTLARDVPYAVVRDNITLSDLYRYRKAAISTSDRGYKSSWSIKAIDDCIDYLEGNTKLDTTQSPSTPHDSPEVEETMRQENAASYRSSIPVYYVYQTRMREEGMPVDLTVLARYPAAENAKRRQSGKRLPEVMLFDHERFFKSPQEWLHPLFLDCQLGDDTVSWHRVMGLGRLNYDSDVDVERFMNAVMQGSTEQLLRLYRVKDEADMEMVERWASGDTASNVLPAGVEVVEQGKSNAGAQMAMGTMSMLQQLTRRNGNMALANGGDKQVNELEVQALERQGRNAAAISNRINEVYEVGEGVGDRIFKSFIAANIMPQDKGYPEIRSFQALLEKEGIPLEFLRQRNKDGTLKNVKIRMNRVAGDGDRVREAMTNRLLMSWMHMFSPAAQQIIMRRLVATETNDYHLSEELVPTQEKPDFLQMQRASNEADTMERRAYTQYISPLNPDDIHMVHVREHLQDLTAMAQAGQAGVWNEQKSLAFMCIGQHTMQHINVVASVDKNVGKQLSDHLQQIAKITDALNRNMQAQQESQEPMSDYEKAQIQLKADSQQLKVRQQESLEGHRAASLQFSMAKAADSSANANRAMSLQERNSYLQELASEHDKLQAKIDATQAGQGAGRRGK